jgi:hypothetical protein
VLASPETPLPKAISQSPSFTIGVPKLSESTPRKVPVAKSKASIRPLPKLPTSSAPPSDPKVVGARAIPHGALSGGPPVRRRCSVPFRS